jgi:hypothetical protein
MPLRLCLPRVCAALLLAATLAPAAASERVETMLRTVAAAPLAESPAFAVGFVDFAALYAAGGAERAGRDFATAVERRDPASLALIDALLRINSDIGFLPYLLTGGARWPEWLGFDFFALDWAMMLGEPPRQRLYLGLQTAPHRAAIEAALAARGLARSESGGVPLFAKGAEGGIDAKGRLPGYPFWGEVGSAERLALLPDALAGSRYDATTAGMTAGPYLGEDAVIAAGVHAVDDAVLPGALLQLTLLRGDFSPDYVKALLAPGSAVDEAKAALEAEAPGPLPPFRLLVLADRQGPAGEETLVALVYDQPAEAAVAAATLPGRLAAYRPAKQSGSLLELLDMTASVGVAAWDGKAVVLLRLTLDPATAKAGRPAGFGYRTLMHGYFMRDLRWLTWK